MERFEDIRRRIDVVLRQAGVKRAAVFGSFARGDATSESDLDLLIEFQEGKGLLDLIALKNHLEEALGMKVDVVTYRSLSPFMRDAIMQEQISVYGIGMDHCHAGSTCF